MNPRRFRSQSSAGGFTLVEIVVSIAVLGLMMIGVAQVMNSAIGTTIGGYKHMDADTQARMVLDRMAFDISRITKRSDVDYYFQKNTTVAGTTPGNDQMAFYSESGGYYPSGVTSSAGGSDVSLVGYMIINNQLCRLSKGLSWNGYNASLPAMVFNPLANAAGSSLTSNTLTSTWSGIANGTDSNYQVIGDQVFRLEYCFLVQSSPTSSLASQTTTAGGFYDSPWETPDTTPNALKDVTAIVVSIAVLDSKSRAITTSAELQTAASDLPDDKCSSVSTGESSPYLPLPQWESNLATALKSGSAAPLGLPPAAASQLRFYQRFCYLNHLQ
jgi:type II secretory pathway pseudopilin PulG